MARGPAVNRDFQIVLEGPFFTRDPRKTVKANIREMMERLAEEAEDAVQGDIAGHASQMPMWTGWTHDRVKGRVHSTKGKRWQGTMVVSANTEGMSAKDAIRTKAAGSGIEARWHPFRRVTTTIRRSKAVLSANLTEGLE